MLSYRHAFHAGNHADVLKHVVLVHLLRYLTQKDKPLWFIDTHAGAAAYALDEGYAATNAEYESGIARLWAREDGPPAIVQAGDGFAGLQAVLPPPSRRALVLIDPSYEDKGDYRRVLAALRDALKRFRAGAYAVWSPQGER